MLYMLVRKFTPSMHKIHDFLFSGEANYNCRYRQQNISSCLMVDRKQGRNVTCLQNYSCLFQTQCLRKGPMSLPLRVGVGHWTPLSSLHIHRGSVFFLKWDTLTWNSFSQSVQFSTFKNICQQPKETVRSLAATLHSPLPLSLVTTNLTRLYRFAFSEHFT